MPPAVRANSPPAPARIASAKRQMRTASDRSRLGSVKPQIPAEAVTISAAGETSRASTAVDYYFPEDPDYYVTTAVVPTTRPPMMETAVPMACGR